MGQPSGNTSSYQRVEAVPSEQQKQLFAFQYGAPNAPGRIMLREASRLGKTIENFNLGKPGSAEAFFGYNPTVEDYRNILSNKPNYLRKFEDTGTKTAANGGLMTLRGYAGGGKLPPAPKNETPAQRATRLATYADKGGNLNSNQQTFVQNYYDNQAVANKNGYQLDYKTGLPVPPKLPASATTEERNAAAAAFTEKTGFSVNDKGQVAKTTDTKPPPYSVDDALYGYTAGYSPAAEYAPWEGITSKAGQQAYDLITNNQMPAEFSAASNMYQASGDALMKAAGYTPSNVSAQSASAGTSSAGRGSASQAQAAKMGNVADVTAPEMQYFQSDRGNIRDATASQAEAYGYDPTMAEASNYMASQMNTPQGIEALGYDAAQAEASNYQAAQMNAPQGIEALGYDAAQMQAAQMNRADVRDIAAKQAEVERYNASLMNAPQDIQAQAYNAAQAGTNQMNMPSSWTEAGTAGKYMNPYIQNVVDIQKREANRDYQKQLNELNKQAVGAKAYGGSRLAIERAEAARNQATKLADIEAEGLNQAYQQGIGQFATEQGQTLQAGQANLTAAQQSELANQQALNTQRQAYVTQALEAAKNNYGGQLTAAQQNQIAQNAAAQFNAQSQNTAYNNYVAQQLAAQQANQQMDFGVGQLNTQNQQAANAANQAAINAQRSQYVTQALEAAKNNYAGELTAEQQNMIARNAEAQFNANANMQTSQYNTAAINAQRSQYVTQALEAAKNNYAGQLTAEQQNMIARNAEAQFNAQANMQTSQYNAASANTAGQYYATAQNQSAQAYAAQQLAVQQLNQGMDAQTVMANLQANLGVQGQEAQQILNAALANQQTAFNTGSFNTGQANQINSLNAQLGTQTNLANQQAALQASLANQQTQFGIGSLNANLANQTALTNAQLGTQASLQNAQLATQSSIANAANQTQISGLNSQLALQGQMANQQAGLTANQQGIAALTAAQGAGQGLLATGNATNNWTLGQAGALGQVMNTATGLQQDYLNQQQKNAIAQQTGAITNTSGPIQITQGTATTPAGQAATAGTR